MTGRHQCACGRPRNDPDVLLQALQETNDRLERKQFRDLAALCDKYGGKLMEMWRVSEEGGLVTLDGDDCALVLKALLGNAPPPRPDVDPLHPSHLLR